MLELTVAHDPAGRPRPVKVFPSGAKRAAPPSHKDYPWGSTTPLQQLDRLEASLLRARALLAAEGALTGKQYAAREATRERLHASTEGSIKGLAEVGIFHLRTLEAAVADFVRLESKLLLLGVDPQLILDRKQEIARKLLGPALEAMVEAAADVPGSREGQEASGPAPLVKVRRLKAALRDPSQPKRVLAPFLPFGQEPGPNYRRIDPDDPMDSDTLEEAMRKYMPGIPYDRRMEPHKYAPEDEDTDGKGKKGGG